MDWFWTVLFVAAFIVWFPMGFFGAGVGMNLILWFSEWREGNHIDWGQQICFGIAVPFAWIFAILEIIIVLHR
jgi:hypothetical protein